LNDTKVHGTNTKILLSEQTYTVYNIIINFGTYNIHAVNNDYIKWII